jgi:hypothetical protein
MDKGYVCLSHRSAHDHSQMKTREECQKRTSLATLCALYLAYREHIFGGIGKLACQTSLVCHRTYHQTQYIERVFLDIDNSGALDQHCFQRSDGFGPTVY